MYNGCIWLDNKKRKEKLGWTYAEMQKMWRMAMRDCKLDKVKTITFKEWRDKLISIEN